MRATRTTIADAGLLLAACVAAATLAGAPRAEEPELLAEAADEVLSLQGVTRVVIEDLPGTVAIRASRSDEMRWMSRSLANRRAERALSVRRDGTAVVVGPGSDAPADEPRFVEMTVAPDIDLEVRLLGGVLHLSALAGDVEVRGSGDLEARGLRGGIDVDLDGGSVLLDSVAGGASIAGRDLDVDAKAVEQFLSLSLEGGHAEVSQVRGDFDADLDGTSLTGIKFEGIVDVAAIGGALRLQDMLRGGRVELEEATLEVIGSGGRVEVDTDSDVQFREIKGGLVVRGYGSSVRGHTVEGALEITSNDAEISVDEINGAVRVRGDGLRVRIRKAAGEATVAGSATAVLAEDVGGSVTIETDFADVIVHRPAQSVRVTSRDGDVRVLEASGPVNVDADGDTVEVGWTTLQLQEDCEIRNASGDVRLVVPPNAAGSLKARAGYGSIVSTAPGVTVGEDASEATASLGRGAQGTLTVSSGGSVYIDGGAR